MLEPQLSFYILVGKRYLRIPRTWLKRGGEQLTLARQPLPDCAIDSFVTANLIFTKIRSSKLVSDKDKRQLSMHRFEVDVVYPPDESPNKPNNDSHPQNKKRRQHHRNQ